MMRKIARALLWIYPLLFLLDGSVSVIDDVTAYFIPLKPLSSLRNGFAYLVLSLTVPYILSLFFFKVKRLLPYWLLPLFNILGMTVSSWNAVRLVGETSLFSMFALSLSPHWIFNKHPFFFITQLTFSVLQIGIGAFTYKIANSERNTLEDGPVKYFKAASSALGFLSAYAIINILALFFLFQSAAKGFLGFTEGNITSVEKVYHKGSKTIHLIPMIHVGTETFYKEISLMNATKKSLVLMEGVSDLKDLLEPVSYKKMAESAGLQTQGDHFRPQTTKELKDNLSYLIADVDASEFNPETRKFLNNTLKDLGQKSFFELLLSSKESKPTSGQMSNFAVDVLEKRNQKLLKDLRANENKFEVFYIPWGALHLPEIEREIIKDGYVQVSSKERPVIPLAEIVNKAGKK